MKPQYICHSDFADLSPINLFHKQGAPKNFPSPEAHLINRHILYRRKVSLNSTENAVLRITADDYYKLYVNGKFVTQGPAPAYPHHYYYNEIDISDYLCEGENTFAVHTYCQGLINRVWVSADNRQMLWLSLDVDGETVLVSDTDWKCTDHTGYSELGVICHHNTAFREFFHSASPEERFFDVDFDDSAWANAAVYQHADYHLVKQPTKQLTFETLQPAFREQIGDTVRVIFEREVIGYLHLTAKGKKGDVVSIRYAEEQDDEGAARYMLRCKCHYEDQWELSGGEDVFRPYDYKAFRYVDIVCPEGVTIGEISMNARYYPYEKTAVYKTENPDLKRILKLCEDTVKYGTQELFLDCATREKGQYLGDLSVAGRSHAALTGDTTMFKKAIRNFCDSSFICPGIMAVSTSSLMQEIADFSLQLPAQVTWVYAMDGDLDFVREVEPYMTGLYRYFLGYANQEGLVDNVTEKWNIVDWPQNLRDGYDVELTNPIQPGVHNVINAFWIGLLEAMDEIYSLLGMPETGMTEKVKKAFIDNFYSKETGLFCDTPALTHAAVHSNLLPLLFEIGTEDEALRDRLIDFVASKRLTSMGVYMAYFTLAAMKKHGRDDLVEKLATDPGCWLLMLSEGATTTYEAWGKDQKKNTSLFHPWATAPLIIFAEGVRAY